jgi:aarF domain-containing kinase
MEAGFGCPPTDIFIDITPQPIAAASLGQVYKARLKSNGKEVAIKVQRPGVAGKVSEKSAPSIFTT